ncbi:MAG: patatin family protein [Lachnospiraceae bacterium]|nr:patatin family protein [Lachnospiraceae bacterium]
MKRGLVMEGGAMRGMFTCGVIDVLMECRIKVDGAAGVSAGAVFGCNIKSHQIGRPIRYNKKYSRDPRYCSFRSLLKTGDMFGAEFCYHTLPEVLDPFNKRIFKKNPMEFYIGATDVMTGRPVFHKCTDGGEKDIEWMRASASMPLVSRVVSIDGRKLLDGGVACPIPYRFLERRGYNRNLIVLTQPKGFVKKQVSMLPIIKLALKDYPALFRAMATRHLRYNAQINDIENMEKWGNVVVIRPPESLEIGRTEKNPSELERVYEVGRIETLKKLDEIKDFFGM